MGDLFSGRESVLEIGIGLVVLLVLVSVGVLIGGRISGGAKRSQRHHEGPPSPGSVPASRHKPSSAAATR